MAYTPTTWTEGVTTLGPTNMNKIETELARLKTGADLSASAAIALSQLADPGSGNVVGSVGAGAVALKPPGYEYAYAEFTSNVSVTATTDATANTVVTAPAVTFDGSTVVLIEFSTILIRPGATANSEVLLNLYQDGSDIGRIWETQKDNSAGANAATAGVRAARRMTPASGSRTYSVRAWRVTSDGTVLAGVGGAGAYMPGFIRITKV